MFFLPGSILSTIVFLPQFSATRSFLPPSFPVYPNSSPASSEEATMIGILLVLALLTAGFFHSYLFGRHKKALISWLVQLVSPCCKPIDALSNPFPPEASHAGETAEKQKEVMRGLPATAGPDAELESVFRTFDGDGDGFITANELEDSLHRLGLLAGGDVKEMLRRVDSNEDGLIDMDEFRELYGSIAGAGGRKKEAASRSHGPGNINIQEDDDDEEEEGEDVDQEEADLREAFGVFDRDGDGLIGAAELRAVLGFTGLRPGATEAECREMINKVDIDGDGMVDFYEFKRMMMLSITTGLTDAGKRKLL